MPYFVRRPPNHHYSVTHPADHHDAEKPPVATDPKSFVTRDWIETVFKTVDTPLRTHRITLSYSKFAVHLDDMLFGEGSFSSRNAKEQAITSANANWFNFATWGTYTLGPNIRNDGAPQRLESLPNSIRRRVAPAIVQSRSADGQLVGRALAWGQELIFLSAGRALLHFRELVEDDNLGDSFTTNKDQRSGILDELNWGGQRWIDEGHLQLIDEAFDCYRLVLLRARELSDSITADQIQSDELIAKLVLLATFLLTAAEQDVVNRALAVVIESVPSRVIKAFDRRLARLAQWQRGVPEQATAYNLFARLSDTEALMSDFWARLMTRYLLVIVLPTELLRLGRDVPLRDLLGPIYPAPLSNLSFDPELFDEEYPGLENAGEIASNLYRLMAFVSELDRSQDGVGSAAHDWRRFDDRLNWAISLFRSRQQDTTLYWPPYSIEDTRRIVRGEMPLATGHPGHGSVTPPLDPGSITTFLQTEKEFALAQQARAQTASADAIGADTETSAESEALAGGLSVTAEREGTFVGDEAVATEPPTDGDQMRDLDRG